MGVFHVFLKLYNCKWYQIAQNTRYEEFKTSDFLFVFNRFSINFQTPVYPKKNLSLLFLSKT